jgi:hypothetical protein
MDSYALKQAFRNAPEKDKMVGFVRKFPETFLDLERARLGITAARTAAQWLSVTPHNAPKPLLTAYSSQQHTQGWVVS